jgi:peroxiredoxin
MPKVSLDTPAPDFTLVDFKGQPVRLADFRGKAHVVLVFNRGFF